MSGVLSVAVIDDWLERFKLIERDLWQLFLRRRMFRRLQEIVAANPKINRPSLLYTYLGSTYFDSSVSGVRRHARWDDQRRDASLLGLLYSIRKSPAVLTRERNARFYQGPGKAARLAEHGERVFDEFTGPGLPCFEKEHVQPGITALRKSALEVERYGTQRIAHLDQERPSEISFPELDAALDELERIVRRYGHILLGRDVASEDSLVLDGGWEAVLMEPWIAPRA